MTTLPSTESRSLAHQRRKVKVPAPAFQTAPQATQLPDSLQILNVILSVMLLILLSAVLLHFM